MSKYVLKSGQINFESVDNPNLYACVVIKNGEIYNLTDDLKEILLEKLEKPQDMVLEDLF